MQPPGTLEQTQSSSPPHKIRLPILPLLILSAGVLVGGVVPFVPTLTRALVFFLAGLGVFVWSWITYRDWATPGNLFAIPWLFDVGLFQLQLLHESVQGSLEPFSYVIIIGSVFCFLVGSFIAEYRISRDKHNEKLGPTSKTLGRNLSPVRMRLVIFLSFLGGVGVWGYLFWRVGGLQTFLTEPNVYRHSFLLPIIDDLYKLLFLSGFWGVYYLCIGETRHRRLITVTFLVSLILIASRLARSSLFLYLIVSLMIAHQVKRIRLRYVAATVATMLLAFVLVQFYRGSQFQQELDYITSGIAQAPRNMPWLAAFYTYTIPNIRNVQIGIRNTTDYEWGRNLLFPVWSFTRTTKLMGFERYEHTHWREIYGLGIFRPYLIDFYRDFGIVGTTLLPGLIGFLSNRLYQSARRRTSALPVYLYALLSFALILSIVDNFFSDSAIWLFSIMFVVTDRFCRRSVPESDERRSNRHQETKNCVAKDKIAGIR
jgi:oligosaccharide repeat unit polymerase